MATTDRTPVENARRAFADAQRTLVDRLYAFETATSDLREAKRRHKDDELGDAQGTFTSAKNLFEQARDALRQRSQELQNAIATWLPNGTGLDEDMVRLDASSPIVLLPVRLETRFVGGRLKLRIFPDEISLNAHETALTLEEQEAAKAYYEELNRSGNERPLWRDMIARFGVPRSAYVLREMLPVFGEEGLGMSSSYSISSSSCGGTLVGGQREDLFFPTDVQSRASTWTRPGEAVLPDRWAVVLYHDDGTSRSVAGGRILEPLQMTPDPKLLESELHTVAGELKVDDKLFWTVDFDRALAVGMALDIALEGNEPTQGFSRIIVVGVKSSMNAFDTSRMLEKLFDAHHYTRGMAIVRQGSPTNNTENRPTPYPVKENAGEFSFGIERQRAPLDRKYSHHCLPFDVDGHHLAMALGVPSGVFANVDRAYKFEIRNSRLMAQALWPGTVGYYMRHVMAPVPIPNNPAIFTPTQIENERTYFGLYVNGRGPAPAFRIGGTPYGVLPIGSLALWKPRAFGAANSFDDSMATQETAKLSALQSLQEIWLDGTGGVPRITAAPNDADVDVATVLSTSPSSRQFWVRYGYSEHVSYTFWSFFGWWIGGYFNELDQMSQDTFGRIGFPNWRPELGRTVFEHQQWLYLGHVVTAEPSEDAQLPGLNFISDIANGPIQQLNENTLPSKPATENLLYSMLRHSLMMEYARVTDLLDDTFTWVEFNILNIPSLTIRYPVPAIRAVSEAELKNQTAVYRATFSNLAGESTAELERLFTETLDTVSHRVDAWITAFAARRLDDMRRAQVATNLAPKGDYLGGYGWLENVRPRSVVPTTESIPGVGLAEVDLKNGGFVHTPSMTHAAAAAVLRNGHLSVKGEDPKAYAIDLSSRRVRSGRRLFEGVRNGQPIAALLGYEFERGLHEGHPGVPDLDRIRFQLRNRFPLVANKSGFDGDETAEVIAARNVVDGSLLLANYQAGTLFDATLPAAGTAGHTAIKSELDRLVEMYDAAADLLTAESVFQLVRGNVEASFPTMSNVVEGKQPPDTVISKSARGGLGIAHRVALVFPSGDDGPELPDGWPSVPSFRAEAEPVLNAWTGQLIGDPRLVSASLTYLDANGEVITSTHDEGGTPVVQQSVTVFLSDLELHPLDVLALAQVAAQSNQGSILDQRLIAAALADDERAPDATPASFRFDYDDVVAGGRSFPQVFEVLNTAGAVFGSSRTLEIKDLLPPAEAKQGAEEDEAEPIGGENALEFYGRGRTARTRLLEAITVLTTAVNAQAGLREALIGAARFASLSAFPDPRIADAALLETARATLAELERRADQLPGTLPAATRSVDLIDNGRRTLQGVFGPNFVAMPAVDPPRAAEIGLSLDARSDLLGGDEAAPDRYLQQIVRSRARLGRWRKLNLYARASRLVRPRVEVVQLPHVPDERWLGLPFDGAVPEEGRSALLLLHYADTLDPTIAWTGLVVDDWTEIIPNQNEETGIALHYDSPQAEAPQAVLVAVPSNNASAQWSFAELIASLEQTMDLMKIRAVSNESLDVGQMFPMTVMPSNVTPLSTVATLINSIAQAAASLGLED